MYHPAAALRSSEVKLKLTMDFGEINRKYLKILRKSVKIQSETRLKGNGGK